MLLARKLAAEFIGTAILVIVAVGTATETFGFKLFGGSIAAGVVTTALAFGLVLIGLAYAIGPISGCHVNPAVTMGFVIIGPHEDRRGHRLHAWPRWLGAIVGATVLFAIFDQVPGYHRALQGLGTDGYGKYSLVGLQPDRRLRGRGRPHVRLRHRGPLRHP